MQRQWYRQPRSLTVPRRDTWPNTWKAFFWDGWEGLLRARRVWPGEEGRYVQQKLEIRFRFLVFSFVVPFPRVFFFLFRTPWYVRLVQYPCSVPSWISLSNRCFSPAYVSLSTRLFMCSYASTLAQAVYFFCASTRVFYLFFSRNLFPSPRPYNTYTGKCRTSGDMQARHGEGDGSLAVVGIACRFPGGCDSPEAFWDFLRKGVDATSGVPSER